MILKWKIEKSKRGLDEKKRKNILIIYLLNSASAMLIIAPTTTTQPEITVTTAGRAGTTSVPSIIPEPTARDTITPTIHIKIPTKLFCILTSFYFLFRFPAV